MGHGAMYFPSFGQCARTGQAVESTALVRTPKYLLFSAACCFHLVFILQVINNT